MPSSCFEMERETAAKEAAETTDEIAACPLTVKLPGRRIGSGVALGPPILTIVEPQSLNLKLYAIPGFLAFTSFLGKAAKATTTTRRTRATAFITAERVPIPCLDNVGSCTYNNVCDMYATVCDKVKPYNLPCPRPIPAGTYDAPASGIVIHLNSPSLSWLVDGDFYVKVVAKNSAGFEDACFEVYFTLAETL